MLQIDQLSPQGNISKIIIQRQLYTLKKYLNESDKSNKTKISDFYLKIEFQD